MAKEITIKQLTNIIKTYPKKSIPAQVATLNKLASVAKEKTKEEIKKGFTLRNNYTLNSLSVKKATDKNRKSMLRTTAEYMGYHETGETIKHNLYSKNIKNGKVATASMYSRGRLRRNELLTQYRFNSMGTIGKRKSGFQMSTSSMGAFIIRNKKTKLDTIYIRVGKGRYKGLRILRRLHDSIKPKAKRFFDKGATKAIKSDKAFKAFSYEIDSMLP